jgi:hypothetical protein
MGKKIGIAIALLLVVIASGIWYLVSNLDSIVEGVVEEQGSSVLGVRLSVGSVAIDLRGGSATMTDVRIDNPTGFESEYAMHYGRIAAGLDLESVGTAVLRLSSVDVEQVRINAEQRDGNINLRELLDNIKANSGGDTDDSGGELRFVIDQFTLTDPLLKGIGFDEKDVELQMGDVVVRNVGDPNSGAGAPAVAAQLLTPVLQQALAEAAKDRLTKKLLGDSDLGSALGEILEKGDKQD